MSTEWYEMRLRVHVPGAEPYKIGDVPAYTLADCIEHEADNVMGEANSDHLEDPSDACRDRLRERVIAEATRALQHPGDEYLDPIGVLWTLEKV